MQLILLLDIISTPLCLYHGYPLYKPLSLKNKNFCHQKFCFEKAEYHIFKTRLSQGKNRIVKSNISSSYMKYLLPKFQNLYFFPSKPNVYNLTIALPFCFDMQFSLNYGINLMKAFLFFLQPVFVWCSQNQRYLKIFRVRQAL